MTLRLFGEHTRFAIGHELRADPDGRDGSWGALQLFVDGRLLTQGVIDGIDGTVLHDAEVPLGDIAEWLVTRWETLSNDAHLPAARVITAARWYAHALDHAPDDDAALLALVAARDAWWRGHSLAAAVPGFRLPDVHLRRLGDEFEVSWDDHTWRTVPSGIQVTEPAGAVRLAIEDVLDPLYAWLTQLASDLATAGSRWATLPERIDARSTRPPSERIVESAGRAVNAAIESIVKKFDADRNAVVHRLLDLPHDLTAGRPFVDELPQSVLLFRSASPTLSVADVEALSALIADAHGEPSARWLELVRPDACPLDDAQNTARGVQLASELRERLAIAADVPLVGKLDLEGLVQALGVTVRDIVLADTHVEGVAIAGRGLTPTMAINRQGRFAHSRWGRRMTIAHELCHLLHDGGRKSRVAMVSNPWAALELERSANAFAITLLAPRPAIEVVLPGAPNDWSLDAVRSAMQTLGIGATALTWQLRNIGLLGEGERRELLDALTGG